MSKNKNRPSAPQPQQSQSRPQQSGQQTRVIAQQQTRTVTYSGPIPNPEFLEHYDRILPGAADRILSMAEKEQAGRIAAQNEERNGAVAYGRRGQWMGFAVAIASFLLSIYFASAGHPNLAGLTIGSTLLHLVAAFLAPRITTSKLPPKSQAK